MVPDEMRPNYARWVRKLFGARARALGFHPKPGESDDDRLLRPVLLSLVADDGEDAALQREAADLAKKWLDAREKPGAAPVIEEDLTGTVLGLAAIHGDRALFDRMREAAKSTKDLRERRRLDASIMSFRDPALFGEALQSLLTGDAPAYERTQMLYAAFGDRHNWPAFYAFVREHFDALAGGLPSDQRATLVWVGGQICDPHARADYQSFFQDRASKLDGGPRNFSQVLESIDLCAARKDAEQPGVVAFLKGY
jgi:alanyl aminopeptidase